jgi:hypothetical protein|tara:strand:- start:237 stop:449 length:213 start_codon:yes stop_codon:yes gene_type:complete
MERVDKDHGSPYDRGRADSWYGREARPHYYKSGPPGEKVEKDGMTKDEVNMYWNGYDDNESDLSMRKEYE